jgi:hypothetical protein
VRRPPKRRLGDAGYVELRDADDPMNSIANLLDIFLVFTVAIIVTFLSSFHLEDLIARDSSVTVLKESSDGEITLITKSAERIEAVRMTRSEAEGRGVRLGVAYRLEDGSMIYLPDE